MSILNYINAQMLEKELKMISEMIVFLLIIILQLQSIFLCSKTLC